MQLWRVRRWLRRRLEDVYYETLGPTAKKAGKWVDRKLDGIAYGLVKSSFIQKRVTLKVPVGKMFLSREVVKLDGLFLKSSGYRWCVREDILADGHVYAPAIGLQHTSLSQEKTGQEEGRGEQ